MQDLDAFDTEIMRTAQDEARQTRGSSAANTETQCTLTNTIIDNGFSRLFVTLLQLNSKQESNRRCCRRNAYRSAMFVTASPVWVLWCLSSMKWHSN